MARRSRRSSVVSGDAFSLFLDTICNAFGGILFISLLVCIMLQLSGTGLGGQKVDKVRRAELQKELSALRTEITRLMDERKTQMGQLELVESAAIDSELLKKYKILTKKELERRGIYQKRTERRDGLLVDLAGMNKRIGQLQKNLDSLIGKYAALRDKLKPQEARRAQVIDRGGVARISGKRQVPVLVSGGRLVFVFKYDSDGKPVAENEAECVFIKKTVDEKAKVDIRPKAGCGILINSPDAAPQALADRLRKFTNNPTPQNGKKENQCHNFMLAVWPDSYKQAETFRNILISAGFEYGLILMEKGKPIGTGGINMVQ